MPKSLVIDGYNLIYASEELKTLMRENVEAARERLIAEVEQYCFRRERTAEVVFDGAGSKGPATTEERSHFLKVIFTGEGRSADSYIEKLAYEIRGKRTGEVLLITGDYDQQKVASGAGMLRMSSREFLAEMEEARAEAAAERRRGTSGRWRVPMESRLPDEVRARLKRFRK